MSSKIGAIPKSKRSRASCPRLTLQEEPQRTRRRAEVLGDGVERDDSAGFATPWDCGRPRCNNLFFRPRSRAPCILENPGQSFFEILGFQIGVSYVNNQGDSQKTAFKATIFLIQHLVFMQITALSLVHFIAHVYLK